MWCGVVWEGSRSVALKVQDGLGRKNNNSLIVYKGRKDKYCSLRPAHLLILILPTRPSPPGYRGVLCPPAHHNALHAPHTPLPLPPSQAWARQSWPRSRTSAAWGRVNAMLARRLELLLAGVERMALQLGVVSSWGQQ